MVMRCLTQQQNQGEPSIVSSRAVWCPDLTAGAVTTRLLRSLNLRKNKTSTKASRIREETVRFSLAVGRAIQGT